MINDYVSNFNNTISYILFYGFAGIVVLLTILLIISLLILILGCLIKSQTIKKNISKK